jgi:hypothetical protein
MPCHPLPLSSHAIVILSGGVLRVCEATPQSKDLYRLELATNSLARLNSGRVELDPSQSFNSNA